MGNLSCCGDHSRGTDELVLQQTEQEEKVKNYQTEILNLTAEIATLNTKLVACEDEEEKVTL